VDDVAPPQTPTAAPVVDTSPGPHVQAPAIDEQAKRIEEQASALALIEQRLGKNIAADRVSDTSHAQNLAAPIVADLAEFFAIYKEGAATLAKRLAALFYGTIDQNVNPQIEGTRYVAGTNPETQELYVASSKRAPKEPKPLVSSGYRQRVNRYIQLARIASCILHKQAWTSVAKEGVYFPALNDQLTDAQRLTLPEVTRTWVEKGFVLVGGAAYGDPIAMLQAGVWLSTTHVAWRNAVKPVVENADDPQNQEHNDKLRSSAEARAEALSIVALKWNPTTHRHESNKMSIFANKFAFMGSMDGLLKNAPKKGISLTQAQAERLAALCMKLVPTPKTEKTS